MSTTTPISNMSYEEALDYSQAYQKRADMYLLIGAGLIGTAVLGLFGLPIFLYALWLFKKGEDQGLATRPFMMTCIGAITLVDAFLNSIGTIGDVLGHHTLLIRIGEMGWGTLVDTGYIWRFNDLWMGGTSTPGEKCWNFVNVLVLFPMRVVAAWGFLQGKRWGLQWMIITCWICCYAWVGYLCNLTIYWESRFPDAAAPVWGWWLYDFVYFTPFITLPYFYTINKELFTDD